MKNTIFLAILFSISASAQSNRAPFYSNSGRSALQCTTDLLKMYLDHAKIQLVGSFRFLSTAEELAQLQVTEAGTASFKFIAESSEGRGTKDLKGSITIDYAKISDSNHMCGPSLKGRKGRIQLSITQLKEGKEIKIYNQPSMM